ncbi:MAG: GTPase [Candidatus Diapherotrites archaeon]
MLEEIMESAFKSARKDTAQSTFSSNRFENEKRKEVEKVKKVSETIRDFLKKEVRRVPNIEELSPFQRETLKAELDINELRNALGHLEKTAQLIKKVRFQAIQNLYQIRRREDYPKLARETKSVYGKIASIVRKAEKSQRIVVEAQKKLAEIPKISEEAPVLLLAGFPNTGKSEILKRLTGSNVKIAQYAFTTQSINVGKFKVKHVEAQVIDCPGLLDREKHSAVEEKALVALTHLKGRIAFIADPSEACGYRINEQYSLFEKMRKEFAGKKFLLVYNKSDIYTAEQLELAKALFQYSPFVETGKNMEQSLKEWAEKGLAEF